MILKIEDEYLEFDGEIILERQVMNIETLDNVGDFSYAFNVEPTAHNKRVLGIESINKTNKQIFVDRLVELQTNAGLPIAYGKILITDTLGIECSFLSGNTNFFNSIEGNVQDIDLSEFDVFPSEDTIVDSWDNTEGVVFPLVDKGGLDRRKYPFFKFRALTARVDFNDFQPFIYVKNVIDGIFKLAGLKLEGDLINESTYNSLITTNNSQDYYERKFTDVNVNIGKAVPQTLTDAGFTKISFEDVTSTQYFNSPLESFSLVNNRWVIPFNSKVGIAISLQLSDDTKRIMFEFRKNGVDAFSPIAQGNNITIDTSKVLFIDLSAPTPGDYFEVWAMVDPSTPGSVDVLSGSFTGNIVSTGYIFAQALLPAISSRDFLKDIFKMFNVICTYDIFSKTVTTKFFKNIPTSEEQDLSQYVTKVIAENGFEVVSDYAKSNILAYTQLESDKVERYNKENIISYGNGEIAIQNDFIESTKDLFTVNFTAPYSQNYPVYGLQLIRLDYAEYVADEDSSINLEIVNVNDSAGEAEFENSVGGFVNLKNVPYLGDATGVLQSVTQESIESSSQIIAINVPNVTLPETVWFSDYGPFSTEDWITIRASNFTIPAYDGDWEFNSFPESARLTAAVAVFARFQDGTPLDVIKQGLSFGPIPGKNTLSLIDTFYRPTQDALNDPNKIRCEMLMPENVYRNIDFLRPVRIKTDKFNATFYINKDTGYESSKQIFEMELIKF